MGRLPALTPAQRKEAARRRARGATLQELAQLQCEPSHDFAALRLTPPLGPLRLTGQKRRLASANHH